MKALRIACGQPVAPFDDPVGSEEILGRTLAEIQAEELEAAGFSLVDEAPSNEPYLVYSDRTWFTRGALRCFLAQAEAPARLRVDHEGFLAMTEGVQQWPERGLYELALLPAGHAPSFQAPPVTVDLGFEDAPAPREHPAMAHAMPEALSVSDAQVHQIDHWSHILRVNWLAMASTIQREKRKFEGLNLFVKAWRIAGLLLRVRSLNEFKLAAGLNQVGKNCRIHPTAVVEASVLGDDVEIGPFAVVRASVVGEGARIEEFATVNMSVIGRGARVGRRGTANLSVLYQGAMVGSANGYQACVFGRDSFCAWSTTVFDLSFKDPIKVWYRGQRVSSGTYFLGAVLGHRARLGGLVSLGYGSEVPNDAFVVGTAQNVLRSWEPGDGPHRVVDGVARPVKGPRPTEEE
jgi:hypothetical protein